jgi:molybdenum cofactor synthesis domain-containing protein
LIDERVKISIMSIRIGIITVSDRSSRRERSDESGPALVKAVSQQGWQVIRTEILPDEADQVKTTLVEWADSGEMDVILTTGGTGFSPRDITPEATQAVIQRPTPGLVEAMRSASLRITPHAMLSRAIAGIRSHTLIVNLPGSPLGAIENLAVLVPIMPHAVQLLRDEPTAEAGHQRV